MCRSARMWTKTEPTPTDDTVNGMQFIEVHDYSYKPTPRFSPNGGRLYFGVELEVEWGDNRNLLFGIVRRFGEDRLYLKYDSSVENGVEIVFQPFQISAYKQGAYREMLDNVFDLRHNGYLSYDARSSCGMHVHVPKSVLTTADLYKTYRFFYKNRGFIQRISGRTYDQMDNWARIPNNIYSALMWAKYDHDDDRHVCLNKYPSDTYEFRIFRGTLHPIGFFKNLEFVELLVEFVRTHSFRDMDSIQPFWRMMEKKRKQYPNLCFWLQERDLNIETFLAA